MRSTLLALMSPAVFGQIKHRYIVLVHDTLSLDTSIKCGFNNFSSRRRSIITYKANPRVHGERGGSVVECRVPEREVRGSRPTAAVLCPWARHFTPRKYWLITQEAMAPSRHDWKIVDWDVKPQHNQPTKSPQFASMVQVRLWGCKPGRIWYLKQHFRDHKLWKQLKIHPPK